MSKTVHLHIEVSRELNNRIKQLVISEESRTSKRVLMKDKVIECLESGVTWIESQENVPKLNID